MLIVKNLTKTYSLEKQKYCANKDINFSVADGKMVWIYGNSGSGKTTLLNMISGLDVADQGSVQWNETDILSLSSNQRADFRLKNMGLVFQFFDMIKTQSIFSNVSIPLKLLNTNKSEINKKVYSSLELFGIEKLCNKKPNSLSGGERQRAAIARAIITKPKILIADEITASLDTEMSKKVYKILKEYIVKNNCIGIFVSHDPLIREFADDIYVMKNGSLIKENELYLKLLCLCYKQLEDNRFLDKMETLELMNENFRKIAVTNLKISVEFKELSEDEIKTIVENDKVVENIDKAIEHLITANHSWVSWMR